MGKQREKIDYSAEMNKHDSRAVRLVFVLLGTLFVLLGIAGIFLPVLPTTPFMLAAAGCYARASTRFYNWLLNNPAFGPAVLEWQRHRSIPWRTKMIAIGVMAVTLGISILFFVPWPELKIALVLFGLLLAAHMYRIPSRDRPRSFPSGQSPRATVTPFLGKGAGEKVHNPSFPSGPSPRAAVTPSRGEGAGGKAHTPAFPSGPSHIWPASNRHPLPREGGGEEGSHG